MNAQIKLILITLTTVLAVGVTGGMGFWQLSRAAEKQARQASMDIQSAKTPLDADAIRSAVDPTTLLYQRARVRGSWVQGSLVFLENRPMNGRVGFLVMMPFVLEGGASALVVQRGWVPRGFEDRLLLPPISTPSGVVEIEGRMALPPSDLFALGAPGGGAIRQNLNLTQFGAETGLPLLPITLQQTTVTSNDGLVRNWPVVNMGVEKNIGYAVQWFGLASLFTVLYVWFQIVRRFIVRPKAPSSYV